MKEKRKFNRYDSNVPIKVEIQNLDGKSEIIICEAINIAAGGVLIPQRISLPEASEVKIEVAFHFQDLVTTENPEGTLIMSVTGYVIRDGPEETAICFNEDYRMSQCLDFLKELNGKSYSPIQPPQDLR